MMTTPSSTLAQEALTEDQQKLVDWVVVNLPIPDRIQEEGEYWASDLRKRFDYEEACKRQFGYIAFAAEALLRHIAAYYAIKTDGLSS